VRSEKGDSREMDKPLRINPFMVPADQQGWRGLSVPGDHKRKAYTILHNDKVLVTALLLIPGERSIRHAHESGELSIHFSSELRPLVTWNPPGVFHGPPPVGAKSSEPPGDLAEKLNLSEAIPPEVAALLDQMRQLQLQVRQLQEELDAVRRPDVAPRVIVDILFPPFKTVIDDPVYPGKKTIVGQWYD
jgi:hypothetical protein